MTKQEVKDIITTKAAAYGFKTEESSFSELPQIARTMESYIGFQIFVTPNHDKTDYEKKIYCMDVEVKASVCRMNPNSTPKGCVSINMKKCVPASYRQVSHALILAGFFPVICFLGKLPAS